MQVRPAVDADQKAITELIDHFFKQGNLNSLGLEFDSYFSTQLAQHLAREHILIVLEMSSGRIIGGIGGVMTQFLLNPKIKIFQEVFFYVKEGFRQASHMLLNELEKECKWFKISKIIMAHSDDGTLDKMGRFYNMKGYKFLEQHFIKSL